MNGPDQGFAIGEDQAGISAGCLGYHFDLAPILAHCESLRRYPDGALVMCQHQVRLLAPGDLFLARDSGFYLIIQTCIGAAADALANEVNLALLSLFLGTDTLSGIAALFRPVAYGEMLEAGVPQAASCVDGMANNQAQTFLKAAGIPFATACPDNTSIKIGAFPSEGEPSSSAYAA
jgi:hypothetical protein